MHQQHQQLLLKDSGRRVRFFHMCQFDFHICKFSRAPPDFFSKGGEDM